MRMSRSYLFVPGDRPDRFAKAAASAADCVVLDLEDAVAPNNKAAARKAVAEWLSSPGSDRRRAMVRVNGVSTPWYGEDAAMVVAAGCAGIMVPKTEAPEAVALVRAAAGDGVEIVGLVETPRAIAALQAIATSGAVDRLAFGTADFCAETGITGDGCELDPVRMQIVIASAVGGLQSPVDGVTLALNDVERVRNDASRACRLGFGGKLCIHPVQVEPANAGFAPAEPELVWARRIVAASVEAVAVVDGKLVDAPIIRRARAILAIADAGNAASGPNPSA